MPTLVWPDKPTAGAQIGVDAFNTLETGINSLVAQYAPIPVSNANLQNPYSEYVITYHASTVSSAIARHSFYTFTNDVVVTRIQCISRDVSTPVGLTVNVFKSTGPTSLLTAVMVPSSARTLVPGALDATALNIAAAASLEIEVAISSGSITDLQVFVTVKERHL